MCQVVRDAMSCLTWTSLMLLLGGKGVAEVDMV